MKAAVVLWSLEDLTGAARDVISTAGAGRAQGCGAGSSEDRQLQAITSQTDAKVDQDRFLGGLLWNSDNGDIQMSLLFAGTLHRARYLALVWPRVHGAPQRSRKQADVFIVICNAMRLQRSKIRSDTASPQRDLLPSSGETYRREFASSRSLLRSDRPELRIMA